jgi:glycosyltransferase involved in cell wall biosynthesis
MNLFAPVGHRRSIMLTAPSAVRDDSSMSLLSFVKWARRTVDAPPRVVLLSGGIMQKDFRDLDARVIDDPASPFRTAERAFRKLGYPRLSTVARRSMHAIIFQQPLQPRCVYASTVHGAGPALRHLPTGARLVVHAYETGDMLDQFIDDAMMRRLAEGVSRWVAASDGVAEGLVERGVDPAAIERCSPFIDLPATDSPKIKQALAELVRLGVQPGEVVVGGIGHSDWRDAPDLFLRVAAMMRRRYPELPLRFVWVGAPEDGPTRWILEHDIRHAGLSDSVTLIGTLADAETWLSTFDILCLTSRVDPPPPTGLQAGALGIPVVGFAQSGLTELEDELGDGHGIEGVPYLDIEAMSERIAQLATDPDARQAAGAEFRRLVLESHLTENRAQALWDLLEREARAAGT